MKEESFGQRFTLALSKLNITAYKLSELTGLPQSTLSNYRNGKSIPNRVVNEAIASKMNINPDWLINGVGSMEIEPEVKMLSVIEPEEQITNTNGNVFTELKNGKYRIYVKKVSVKAFGSYLSDNHDPEFLNELEQVSFTVDHIGKGNYICFEVQGDSMNGGGINDAPEGAELLCRELGRQHWKDGFRDSQYGWVVVHNETVLYKDIKSLDMNNGELILSSRSGLPQHSDFTVNMNDVRQIWKVIKRAY